MKTKIYQIIIIALMVAFGAFHPAQAQLYPYPVIIVPPPAQNLVVPKPAARAAMPDKPNPPSAGDAPAPLKCHYQGQTRVCE